MRHERFELMDYANNGLMDELNEFMVCCKVHLFGLPIKKPKPTVEEIDSLMFRLMTELKKDAKPYRKS